MYISFISLPPLTPWQRSQFCSLRLPATSGFEPVIPRWWSKRFLLHQLPIRRSVYAIIMGVLPWDFGDVSQAELKRFFSAGKACVTVWVPSASLICKTGLQQVVHIIRESGSENCCRDQISKQPLRCQTCYHWGTVEAVHHLLNCTPIPQFLSNASSYSASSVQSTSYWNVLHFSLYTLAPCLMSCLSIITCIWSCCALHCHCCTVGFEVLFNDARLCLWFTTAWASLSKFWFWLN